MKVFLGHTNFGISKINQVKNTDATANIQVSKPLSIDAVAFGAKPVRYNINVPFETAKEVADKLANSTSGLRAPLNSELYNRDTIQLLTLGAVDYAKKVANAEGKKAKVIVATDTRDKRASKPEDKFLPLVSRTARNQGVDVLYCSDPTPIPLIALLAREEQIPLSFALTPSHNPWTDRGFNLITPDGAVAPYEVTKQVGDYALEHAKKGYFTTSPEKGKSTHVNPYNLYKNTIEGYNLINWQAIKDAKVSVYYDALQGTGEYVVPKLLREHGIKITNVNSGDHKGPNPTQGNLQMLAQKVSADTNMLKIGLANDGDGDRFGIIDEKGNFISPNDVILLTAYHLHQNKGKTGAIIRSQATSSQLDVYARNNGLEVIQTPVGFKFIAEDIMKLREEGKDILVAGEESGGLTINGHIPEKDGIVALLLMLDLVATEKKPISQILSQVKKDFNTTFISKPINIEVSDDTQKETVMHRIKDIYNDALNGNLDFAGLKIDLDKTKANMESMNNYKKGGDGVKLYFEGGAAMLIRKSGTEPLLKVYIETSNDDKAKAESDVARLEKASMKLVN